MKSAILGAESVFEALKDGESGEEITSFEDRFKDIWLYKELDAEPNSSVGTLKFGTFIDGAIAYFEQNIMRGSLPITFHGTKPDYATLKPADQTKKIDYPKPDNKLTFDKLSSVFISNPNHDEDQPIHLKLTNPEIPIKENLPKYNEPAQRYCPAGVYEVVEADDGSGKKFQINAQNCVHCKTCDIKDPSQNITWVTPEGGGGPTYPNM